MFAAVRARVPEPAFTKLKAPDISPDAVDEAPILRVTLELKTIVSS